LTEHTQIDCLFHQQTDASG